MAFSGSFNLFFFFPFSSICPVLQIKGTRPEKRNDGAKVHSTSFGDGKVSLRDPTVSLQITLNHRVICMFLPSYSAWAQIGKTCVGCNLQNVIWLHENRGWYMFVFSLFPWLCLYWSLQKYLLSECLWSWWPASADRATFGTELLEFFFSPLPLE